MSLVSGARDMGLDDNKNNNNNNKEGGDDENTSRTDDEAVGSLGRQMSEASLCATEEEEDEDSKLQLGPQYTIKEHLEKDKDDESLRKWKEQLLGSVDVTNIGETLDPEVRILSLAILSPGKPDIVLLVPENGNPKGMWFTLKEGSKYNLKFTFQVNNNIVSGLRYTNTVWKTGVKVDRTKEMLGTFSPQSEPYNHVMPEETTPSGMFARGSYSARTKFLDDDNKCYLEINYSFDIRKEWPAV
ncbi:PREDICTED: rho GDP-dissociation inhibitor 1 [Camelina sativa]|uniref:Rho GDP-dissociation inhibitor 1 n=1 Tax=Camelina sativa TaxID=90675 RepID=A0ABM0XI70_CAMSA|nr:PREDICTED: rho GDP-dissociation inhibitor 1 [Camelina sativa]